MSEKICKNCQHWKLDEKEWAYNELVFAVDPATFETIGGPKCKFCKSPKLKFFETPDPGGATVIDGSQYCAALLTAPDFGCVGFEGVFI